MLFTTVLLLLFSVNMLLFFNKLCIVEKNSEVTSSICNDYSDFTGFLADVTPGNTYSLDLDLGTCHLAGFALLDIAKVYVDWNLDGDFFDVNELIAIIPPTQSPSSHTLSFTVPSSAIPGQSRMRIVMQNSQYQSANQSASKCL